MKKNAALQIIIFFFFCVTPLFVFCADEDADSLRRDALAGDISAQFKLANEYFYGTAERKINYTLAAHWFRQVADAGIAEGMFNYGICLEQGLGVEKNPYQAFLYYERASKKDFAPAAFNCALTLMRGIPADAQKNIPAVQPDKYRALALLERLITENFAPAKVEMAEYLLRSPDSTPENHARAFKMLLELSKMEHPGGRVLRLLADCYYGGRGTAENPKEMIKCLENSFVSEFSYYTRII